MASEKGFDPIALLSNVIHIYTFYPLSITESRFGLKDILLIGIVIFVIISLIGNTDVNISPELEAQLTVQTDRSQTTIEHQINNYIEEQVLQTFTTEPIPFAVSNSSSTIADGRPGEQCFLIPGDEITMQGSNGECYVTNNGLVFFISPKGTRSYLRKENKEPLVTIIQPTSTPNAWEALAPYANVGLAELIRQVKAKGYGIPFLFVLWNESDQREYLIDKLENK